MTLGGRMKSGKRVAVIAAATSFLLVIATPAFAGSINGSGATFAAPLIDACKVEFSKDMGHTVNYSGGGSGKGRTDFSGNLVDFAGTDAPYTSGLPTKDFVYAPIYAAPIAIMYNLPTVKEPIYISPKSIARIFSGEIRNWNHPDLAKDNERVVKTPVTATKQVTTTVKGKKVTKTVPVLDKAGKPKILRVDTKTIKIDLPDQDITVWYRTDSSGTSENFTKFLRGTTPSEWTKSQNAVFGNGTPTSIANFFHFQGASGSAAVSAGVKSKVGSITYSELSFATDNKLPVAFVQNAAGEFVKPDAAGTSAFLGGGKINDNGTVDVDFVTKISGAYPLGTTSYGLAYVGGKDANTQKIVADWFTYVLDKCPTKFPEKGFAQLTGPLYTKAKAQIAKIK
jgi:phosphate transport system substrate-binding protein